MVARWLVGSLTAATVVGCHAPSPRPEVVDVATPPRAAPTPAPPRGAPAPPDVGRTRTVELEPDGDWGEERCGPTTGVRYHVGRRGDADGAAAGSPDEADEADEVTTDCLATFDTLHRSTAVPVGVEPFVVRVSDVAVTHGDATLFGVRDTCQEMAEMDGCGTDETDIGWSLMSLVGPIVTIRTFRSSAGGGGPYYHHESWWTIDLRTGEPAAFDALVTADSLLDGLRASTDLRAELDGDALARLAAARTLDEAFAAAAIVGHRPHGSLGFAFPRAPAGSRTRMRIGHRESMVGMLPNQLETVDVVVAPRPEARVWFLAASRGLGVLAGDELH